MADIQAFTQQKVHPEYRPLVEKFRKLVQAEFPQLHEEMRGGTDKYYGVPVYRLKRIVLTLSPTKKGITYAFSDGGQFKDTYKLLEGTGSKTLNIHWSRPEEFDEAAMKYYLAQAIAIDNEKG